jgi:hypothetical protein
LVAAGQGVADWTGVPRSDRCRKVNNPNVLDSFVQAAIGAVIRAKEVIGMSELTPFGGGLAPREARGVSRQLARMGAQGQLALGRIEIEADLQAARVHGVAYVGKQAMQATAIVSELEGQLGRMVPGAKGRLQWIADVTTLGMAEVVADTVRKVSR